MKIHWYDRILLFVIALFMVAATALFVGLLSTGVQNEVAVRVRNLPMDRMGSALLIGAAVITAVLAVYLLIASLGRRKVPAPKNVVIRTTDVGEVNITLAAIDTLVQKSARAYPSVRDCLSRVMVTQFGDVAILLRLSLLPDANIPDLSAQMQAEIKEFVQVHTGVTVREIQIQVESTGVNPAARVQ